jgi:antitoxin component YwqK of YwqJK toxin-antitoxin module
MLIGKDSVKIVNGKAVKISNKQPYSGEFKEYYPGDVKISGNYLNGKKQGVFYYYSPYEYSNSRGPGARNLDSTVNFSNGKREGEKIIYHEMPVTPYIKAIEHYKNDLLDCVCDYWNYSGQLEETKVYEKGKVINEKKYEVDTSFYRLEFGIVDNRNDTISRFSYKANDSLFLEVYGLSDSPIDKYNMPSIITSLTKRGFRVKSFNVGYSSKGWPDYQVASHSGNAFIIPKQYIGMQGVLIFYIDKVVFSDHNGKDYTLTGKRYVY